MSEVLEQDPFAAFKANQRAAWASFAPMEAVTMIPAAKLVAFAQVRRGQRVLDVGCGTGVVAVTAARLGANVEGIDLSPVLLERAQANAAAGGFQIEFREGDAESLPYGDAAFDAVLSQFGHIFAPRPEVATREMLRVLRPGGCIAFSSWPAELFVGRQLKLLMQYAPPPQPGAARPASPAEWGEPGIVRERLGDATTDIVFARGVLVAPTLSPRHTRILHETTIGLFANIIARLQSDPARLAQLRAEYESLIAEEFRDNRVSQDFLMTRASKRKWREPGLMRAGPRC